MFGFPSWTTYVGAAVLALGLYAFGYFNGRTVAQDACTDRIQAEMNKALADQAKFAEDRYKQLKERFDLAFNAAKLANKQLTEAQNEVTRLSLVADNAIKRTVPKNPSCRIPVDVLRALNSLRARPASRPADPAGTPAPALSAAGGAAG